MNQANSIGSQKEVHPFYHVYKDGDKWCAIDHASFGCLADSPAGYGDTPEAALTDLLGRE